jgi:hypothetical protein
VRDPSIAAIVPVTLHHWPDVQRVILAVESREPLTFARAQVVDWDTEFAPVRLAAVGLLSRRWIGECDEPRRTLADVVYVCKPHLDAVRSAYQTVIDAGQTVSAINRAEAQPVWLNARFEAATLPQRRSQVVTKVHNRCVTAVAALRGLRKAKLRREQATLRRAAGACADVTHRHDEIADAIDAELQRLGG